MLLLLYKVVLNQPFGELTNITYAKRPENLPTVLNKDEVIAVLSHLENPHWLMACRFYGPGKNTSQT